MVESAGPSEEIEWISEDDWRTIVVNVPIVSVDLLVRHDDGILLGKRTNQPAQGCWFLPDGRVRKGETREEVVHRVAEEELRLEVEIVEPLGTFEHIYETADVPDVGEKYYLANEYAVGILKGDLTLDDQHDAVRTFASTPEQLHEYVVMYLNSTLLHKQYHFSFLSCFELIIKSPDI